MESDLNEQGPKQVGLNPVDLGMCATEVGPGGERGCEEVIKIMQISVMAIQNPGWRARWKILTKVSEKQWK